MEEININAKLTYLNRDIDTYKKIKQILGGMFLAETKTIERAINAEIQVLEAELDKVRKQVNQFNHQ